MTKKFKLNKWYNISPETSDVVMFTLVGALFSPNATFTSAVYVPTATPKDFGLVGNKFWIENMGQDGYTYTDKER